MYSLHYVTYTSGHKVITNQNQYEATSVRSLLIALNYYK
jgi:hypothetical protein